MFAPLVVFLLVGAVAVPASAYEGRLFNVDATINGEPINYSILYEQRRAEKITASASGEAPATVDWLIESTQGRHVMIDQVVVVKQTHCDDPVPACRETIHAESATQSPSFEFTFDEAGSYFVWIAAAAGGGRGSHHLQIDTHIEIVDAPSLPSSDVPGRGDEQRSERANEAIAAHCDRGQAADRSKHCR